MIVLVIAAGLSGAELGALVSLLFVLVAPVVLALALDRYVFDGEADPVGLEDLEGRSDNPEMWVED